MPVKHLAFFAVAVCLLASCKKNNGNNSNGDPNKLKMYIESDSVNGAALLNDTFYMTYDNNNRLTSVTGRTQKLVYAYQSNTVTFDSYQYNQLSGHEIFYINSSSMVDSTLSTDYDNYHDTTTEGYRYNGSLLTTKLAYSYSSYATSIFLQYDYTYDNDGNLLREVESGGSSNTNIVTTITYTTHPVNVTINPTFVPQQAKYLPATLTVTDSFASIPVTIISYTYSFDGSDRLAKETDSVSNGEVFRKTYVYE